MPRTPIAAVIHFTLQGNFDRTYPEHVSRKATALHVKGWLGELPEHKGILVGIATGDPHHVRKFADTLGQNQIPAGQLLEMDCYRWEEDISDHEQALILKGLRGFEWRVLGRQGGGAA